MLFQRFDRLLFLAKGGRTVYFGKVGENSNILTKYFERNGAFPCPKEANPAEWMLEVIGAAPGSHSDIDWHETWKASPERAEVRRELAEMKEVLSQTTKPAADPDDKAAFREFAAPFGTQMWEVQKRVFAQYWRTPSYIYSKLLLCTLSALFIGFSFVNAGTSQQALQNQLFAIFSLFTIFGQLVQQILPHFVIQRALYEARERPSKTYSWKAFMISNLVVELPWNALAGLIIFFCFYYPVALYKNAEPAGQVHERGILFFLLTEQFLLFTSTFSTMVIAAIDTAETAGNIGNLLFSLTLIFCGVLAAPGAFPHFWIFMYRVSPFTYLVDSMLSVGLANTQVVCAANELLKFAPPAGQTCETYLGPYIAAYGGYNQFPQSTTECSFCAISDTNTFLRAVSSNYANRWRNFGILWIFIIFNGCAAVLLYWLARVPKKGGSREKKNSKKIRKGKTTEDGVEKS